MSKLVDIRIYHFILKVLPAITPKCVWRWISSAMFTTYLLYAKMFRPLLFGTPSERALEYSWVLRNLHKEGKRMLNVGCGDSLLSGELARRGYECYNMDLICYPLSKQLPIFLQCDIKNLPFQNSSFDQITAISTLEHIHGDDGVLMKELNRVLKDGGLLLVTMPLGDYSGACSISRLQNLLTLTSKLSISCEQCCLAQGRRWQIFSGDKAREKIHPYLNKAKIIIRLAFTKGLNSTDREASL